MNQQLTLTGMVISSMPIGEYDKRIVLLTAERGKITAFSRGSRRQNSTMLGATEPCVFGRFILNEGRNSYQLVGAEIQKYYMELRDDLLNAAMSFYCLEFAGFYAKENLDGSQMVNLLAATFNALCKKKIPPELIRRIFELKMVAINGEAPQVFHCMRCGSEEEITLFAMDHSGVLCKNCRSHTGQSVILDASTLYTMQYIISTEINRLYTFTVNNHVLTQLDRIVSNYVRIITEQKFKSEEMLDLILDGFK